jgi:hypothetical protein
LRAAALAGVGVVCRDTSGRNSECQEQGCQFFFETIIPNCQKKYLNVT